MTKKVCAIFGVGAGNGAAFARRFAADDHAVALVSRSKDFITQLSTELSDSRAYTCDVMDPNAITQTCRAITGDMGDVDTLIYNAGSGVFGTALETAPQDFEDSWRINTLGALNVVQNLAPAMIATGRGNIIFVGATASLRGGVNFAAFASAKAAQRSLAQSLARQLWPQNIHVSLLILDGVVDMPKSREMMPDQPDDYFMQPDSIADAAFRLTEQQPSAWSFELDLRPFRENW